MSEQLSTTIILTHSPYGKPRVVTEADAKTEPAETMTRWDITHTEPLIQHELEAARRVAAYGLIAPNGLTQRPAEMLAKGAAYLELCGKTIARSGGGRETETFTPTPDKVNEMPKAVLVEFGMLLEFGKLPTAAEVENAGE